MIRHALALGACLAALPAVAQTVPQGAGARDGRTRYVTPYVELGQIVAADLTNDDIVTYTQAAIGIDAGVIGRRAEAQVSYRYDRFFSWQDGEGDADAHTGLARGSLRVTPALSLEAGAVATRARSDIRGGAPGNLVGVPDNVTQVYSLYAGPSLSTNAGPAQVSAAYFAGYTKVEAPDSVILAPGDAPRDYYDDATNHLALASVALPVGAIAPFGVTVSGAYEREDAGQLDGRYLGWFGRGDVLLPVSRTVALRGGVGYERIETSQREALTDPAGNPVLDGNGRLVTDPASPRRIAYDVEGLIYDAGVVWRPSPRLELQASAGHRYGGETYFGTLSWQIDRETGLGVVVYDGIGTFGRQLRDGLRDLPTAFQTPTDPFGQQFNGCIFGSRPGVAGGAGACLNEAFQSISTASYRARGVDAVLSVSRARTAYAIGAGYAHRKLYAPRAAPGIDVFGADDESVYAQAFWSRVLSRDSTLDANVLVNYFDTGVTGIPGSTGVLGFGANASYQRSLGRLGTIAALGVYAFDQEDFEIQWSAQALLGARYSF